MTPPLIIFVDSDVIISSVISNKGAAYLLLHQSNIERFISNYSRKELKLVIKRLNLSQSEFRARLNQCKIIKLDKTLEAIKKRYTGYIKDQNDAHIVAGAVKSKARFLLTYNIKHFVIDKIKNDFDVLCLTPAQFLQYLRVCN